jgi:hypothetical protein
MSRRVEMFRGVLVRRIVAASDVTANFAKPQMNPPASGFQTIFAPVGARSYLFYFIQMLALRCHIIFLD